MENLYLKSPDLLLRPDYRDSLLDLCRLMLLYFADLFEIYRGIISPLSKGGPNQAVFTQEMRDSLVEELRRRCKGHMESVRVLNKFCRGFTIKVVADESWSESESDGVIDDEIVGQDKPERDLPVEYEMKMEDTGLEKEEEKSSRRSAEETKIPANVG
jgi:hypothetical protein